MKRASQTTSKRTGKPHTRSAVLSFKTSVKQSCLYKDILRNSTGEGHRVLQARSIISQEGVRRWARNGRPEGLETAVVSALQYFAWD